MEYIKCTIVAKTKNKNTHNEYGTTQMFYFKTFRRLNFSPVFMHVLPRIQHRNALHFQYANKRSIKTAAGINKPWN